MNTFSCAIAELLIWIVQYQNPTRDVVYLDYAASHPVSASALCEFIRVASIPGNSSGFNPYSKHLKQIELNSKQIIANKISANYNQIHFTFNATLANNVAILGVAYKYPKCHIITSKIEHPGMIKIFKHLESIGYEISYIDVDNLGKVDINSLKKSFKNNTKLVSIQMVNSETGVSQDIKKIAEISHQHGAIFHCDASQAFCRMDIDVEAQHIDLMTFSGYKIGAPQGIAALYVKDPTYITPILFGSGDLFFPGSVPTALIASFAKIVESFRYNHNKIEKNYNTIISKLSDVKGLTINSFEPNHILSFSVNVDIEDIVSKMNKFAFSSGCSCSGFKQFKNISNKLTSSLHLLRPRSTIRISFDDDSMGNLIKFTNTLKSVLKDVQINAKSTTNIKPVIRGCRKDG